jgi:hypothetical protein
MRKKLASTKVNDLMTSHTAHMQESEIALIVASDQPRKTVERIASLTSIAGYQLLARNTLVIHDLYFDTPDRAFAPPKLALRVREFGATRLLALKGPSKATDWGGVERLEIEEPWSHDALATVIRALADRGIETPRQWRFSEGHPRQVLADLGFQVIQDRETHRQARNIVGADKDGIPTLAELAIDSVLYRLEGKEIRHHEVEIEAKAEVGVSMMPSAIDGLTILLGDLLRVWDHSKLAIGFALEELVAQGELEELLDLNGDLTPAAYDKIDRYLSNGDG